MYMTQTPQNERNEEALNSNYFRPLATKFDTRTKKRLHTLAQTIAHFAEEPAIQTTGEAHAYKCQGTLIYPDGTVMWGDELDTGLISYITRYLQHDEDIEGEEITSFPVSIIVKNEQLELEREWWAPRHVRNIERILTAKQALLAKALRISEELVLPVRDGNKLIFRWLTDTTSEQLRVALPMLLGAIHAHAATSRKLQATSSATGNEKYVMRCWLLRLGFNGREHHSLRVALGANLSGSAAHRITPTEGEVA